jgi:uncharacterized protein YggU (UPF0235/DUF167 family)
MPSFIKVKVRADARRNSLSVKSADTLLIEVKAPAEGGRANAAVLALVATHLDVPAKKLWIIKGAHSPAKIIEVRP